jgi:alpha-methylacyl-CoA racemase
MEEAPEHPHNRARQTFIEVEGVVQPAPAPRFSRTSPEVGAAPPLPGRHTDSILAELGFGAADIARLKQCGAA